MKLRYVDIGIDKSLANITTDMRWAAFSPHNGLGVDYGHRG